MSAYRKLLVTGHLGFIGSAFCHLYADHYDITAIDFAGAGSMEENLARGVHDIRADIADSRIVQGIFEQVKPDAIVNFAAESHVDRANQDDLPFWRSNVLGARNLALQASRFRVRLVHVSTDEVYGDATGVDRPWDESSPMHPKNPYAVTKASAELLLGAYAASHKHQLDLVITRGANTVGPRQFPEKAVPKAIACFLNDLPFPLFKSPARRMWMDVTDHASGIEAALVKGQSGEVYNLAPPPSSEALICDVINRVKLLIGRGEVVTVEDRDNYDLRYWMTATKAERDLNWRPRHDLDKCLTATVNWYLNNPGWLSRAMHKVGDARAFLSTAT